MVIIIWEDEVEAQAQKGKVGGKNLKVIWKTYNFWIANNKWIWFCVCVCVCVCVCPAQQTPYVFPAALIPM